MSTLFSDPVDPKNLPYGVWKTKRLTEEHILGDMDKSILFLSGLSPEDLPLSLGLQKWFFHICNEKNSDGFDLDHLKKRCRIRVIPALDEFSLKLNQNGIRKNENNCKNTKNQPDQRLNHRGVNLNRNFNANWLRMIRESPGRTDCGPFPESESAVAAAVRKIKENPPESALILMHGQNALYYPEEATEKEQKEAFFLGRYAALTVRCATDTTGTALQWLTDRGIKALELRWKGEITDRFPKTLRNLLLMCAALT